MSRLSLELRGAVATAVAVCLDGNLLMPQLLCVAYPRVYLQDKHASCRSCILAERGHVACHVFERN
jgi:hypothetical protein